MADEADRVSDSWRIDQEIMRRNAAPPDPAAIKIDDLILFLDQALRLVGGEPAPPRTTPSHLRDLI